MFDVPQTNIAKFFEEAADFIDDALKNNGDALFDNLKKGFIWQALSWYIV